MDPLISVSLRATYFKSKGGFTKEGAKKFGFQKSNKYGFKKKYIPWNKGKHFLARNLKGKTYEEIYGIEKATELRINRSNQNNHNWKGEEASYHSLHSWVRTRLGTPKKCSRCSTIKPKIYDWANISGKYKRDIADWTRLCRKCHREFDERNNRGNKVKQRFYE